MAKTVKLSLSDLVIALDTKAHCLNFRVEMHPIDALEWAEKFSPYNRIRNGDLPRLIKGIGDIVPATKFGDSVHGVPNANNGMPHHKFEIGNEGSVVIYLVIRHFYLPAGVEVERIKADVMALATRCHADEVNDVSEDRGETRIRMWWD